ncbi:MAG TPA: S41 family peptidase [Anaerolineales bacterium]|nr:S41 family peptidase [Anaerolineales bacterium]
MKNIWHNFTARPAPYRMQSSESKPALYRMVVLLVSFSLVLAGCIREAAPFPTPSPMPAGKYDNLKIETTLTTAERRTIFEAAWQKVNELFHDPDFGGKDWQAIGDEYRKKLPEVQDDHTFWFELMNPMLFELGVSHIGAFPAELSNQLSAESFARASLGMDVRQLDGVPVITRVLAGSPAEQAGLRPGYVITAVDGMTQEDFAAVNINMPPYNERHQRARAVVSIRSAFYGEVGAEVVIEYLDASDQLQKATMQFAPRSNLSCGHLDPALPQACAELEVRRLDNGIGYLRLSGFLEPVLEGMLKAIEDLHDAPVLIIDLRGNIGGVFPVRKAIASQLVGDPKLFMRYEGRDGAIEAYLDAVSNPYSGEVLILVDETSVSSSEEFTGSLQAIGRATVIGSQTPGNCLVATIEILPNEAILMVPYRQSVTPDGRILEDNGVVPEIEIELDRQQLLQGFDAQLEAAIEYAVEQIRE